MRLLYTELRALLLRGGIARKEWPDGAHGL